MSDENKITPEQMAEKLKKEKVDLKQQGAIGQFPAIFDSNLHEVFLTTKNGHAVLNWKYAFLATKSDWIGLYENSSKKDEENIKTITNTSWQWACRGSSYETWEKAKSGMQARYLVWDYSSNKYVSVKRSQTMP